jgi:tetratricopeptide (TPR) repeat protein
MSVGKTSRKKKVSTNEALFNQGRREKELKPSQEPPSKASFQKATSIIKFIPILILLLVSFVAYFNALSNGFVYDDMAQVLENPWIKDIRNLPDIFSKSAWSFLPGLSTSNYYRPMMHIVYMLNYHLFGLKPWGFHLVNILFHCGASVLVFLIIRGLLTEQRVTTSSAYLSPPFIAAMLFASHPIHTEAVTWIAGLPDVAFTFFYLLSFYLYISFRDGAKRGYLLSILAFAVATLLKEPALTLLIMLIAYDYQVKKLDETISAGIKRYIPYVVVSVVYLLVRYYVLRSFTPIESYIDLSTYESIINVFPLFREYLTSLLWPFNLNLWHTFHPITSLFEAKGIISIVVTVIFFIVAVAAYRKNKVLFFGLLLLVIPLLPVFYIKGISGKPYAERYLYLPSVGYVFLLAIFLSWAKERLPRKVRSITIVFIVIVGLYTAGTINRNNVWKDNFSLWSDTVNKSPDSAMAHELLGTTLLYAGRNDEALEQYQIALRIDPTSVHIYRNRGLLYMNKGLLREAIIEFQKALQTDSDNPDTHYKLGLAYAKLGMRDEAMEQYGIFIESNKDSPEIYVKVGIDLGQNGIERDAVAIFEKALKLDPNNVDAHYNLGHAYANSSQFAEAIEHFLIAVKLQPNNPFLRNALGVAYEKKGLYVEAVEQYKAAVQLSADEPVYRGNLERAIGLKGSTPASTKQAPILDR